MTRYVNGSYTVKNGTFSESIENFDGWTLNEWVGGRGRIFHDDFKMAYTLHLDKDYVNHFCSSYIAEASKKASIIYLN